MARQLTVMELADAPRWGRRVLNAIVSARWASVAIADLPCRASTVDRLAARGWVEVWRGLEGGDHATLTAIAAVRLGVRLDDEGTVRLSAEMDFAGRDYLGEERPPVRALGRRLEERSRWYAPGDRLPEPRMPKVRGFVPLPFAARVVAPPEPDPEEPAPPPPAIARLELLGAVATLLKPAPRSHKRKGKRKRRRSAARAGRDNSR